MNEDVWKDRKEDKRKCPIHAHDPGTNERMNADFMVELIPSESSPSVLAPSDSTHKVVTPQSTLVKWTKELIIPLES